MLPSFDRIRQPKYTGPNRCWACTAINLVLTALLAVVVGFVWYPLGFLVAVGGLSLIYLRGYLVPGTPALTKRYLPTSILQWFGITNGAVNRETLGAPNEVAVQEVSEVTDPETFLRRAGALTDCAGDDLCLTGSFADRWEHEMRRVHDDEAMRAALATVINADEGDISLTYAGDTTRVFAHASDDSLVGQWVSSAALRADVAGVTVLSEETSWSTISGRDRAAVLASLRVFVPSCPDCGGKVAFHEDETGGCCWSTPVALLRCEDCEVPLLRLDQSTVAVAN